MPLVFRMMRRICHIVLSDLSALSKKLCRPRFAANKQAAERKRAFRGAKRPPKGHSRDKLKSTPAVRVSAVKKHCARASELSEERSDPRRDIPVTNSNRPLPSASRDQKTIELVQASSPRRADARPQRSDKLSPAAHDGPAGYARLIRFTARQ